MQNRLSAFAWQHSNIGKKQLNHKIRLMPRCKHIALVAHDNMKQTLLTWADQQRELLSSHKLFATGTTGALLQKKLDIPVESLLSGPMGGDQQLGARIATQQIDMLVFFWDPLEQQPHDPDIKALLRLAAVWNIPVACNAASADFMFSSSYLDKRYQQSLPDYDDYLNKRLR